MKRTISLILALLMLCSMTVAAVAEEMMPGYYTPPVMNDGQYPIAQEGVKLTFWQPISGQATKYIQSHDENLSYVVAQNDTGVDIEFIHPIAGSEQEAFNLLLNSGNLPDMIQISDDGWYNGGLQAMYDDGIIVDLTPYLDEYAPQYKEVIEYDDLGYAQTHLDGKVLGFYKITYADKIPYIRFNTNKEWLAEYGQPEPKTTAEYEAYFDWILENKPGVTPVYFGLTYDQSMNLTMGAFDMLYNWYLDREDGRTVKYWANSESYKDWLELMRSWYEKGYFSRDFVSLTGTETQSMFDAGKLAVIADSVDATESRVIDEFPITNFPYMRPTEDYVLGSNLASNPVGDGGDYITVITTACENVEAAVQFMNYGYTFEGSLPYNFGVEGEAWNWNEENMPEFTELCTNNPDGMTNIDVCWVLHAHFATRYTYPDDLTIPTAGDVDSMAIRTLWADDTNEQNFLQMPPYTLTTDESSEYSDLMIQVETFAQEKMYQFITGAESLDNFDAYVAEVNEMGLTRATEIVQAASDRFFANAR